MKRPHRSVPWLAVAAIALALPATAGQFKLQASLTPTTSQQGTTHKLAARLSPVPANPVAHTAAGVSLVARLEASPMACHGDTIFRDSFDWL